MTVSGSAFVTEQQAKADMALALAAAPVAVRQTLVRARYAAARAVELEAKSVGYNVSEGRAHQ